MSDEESKGLSKMEYNAAAVAILLSRGVIAKQIPILLQQLNSSDGKEYSRSYIGKLTRIAIKKGWLEYKYQLHTENIPDETLEEFKKLWPFHNIEL